MPRNKREYRRARQEAKNEQYKASREYDSAAPGSAKERMAKLKFESATRLRKKIEREYEAQTTDSNQ